jgi:hypothetical protein
MSLLEIINIIFVAETSAVFGLLYFLSIEKGMILSFIGDIIFKEERYNEQPVEIEYMKDTPKWKKPLGACQTCTMVWVGVLTYIIYLHCLPLFIFISVVSNGLLIFRKIA